MLKIRGSPHEKLFVYLLIIWMKVLLSHNNTTIVGTWSLGDTICAVYDVIK